MFSKKDVQRLIIPLMIEQVFTALMGTADTMMVGNAGAAAISAVSLVDSINILMLYIFSAMAAGGTIVCAQYLGRGNAEEATENGKQLIVTLLGISLAITILCMALNRPLLRLVFGSVDDDVMSASITYFLITALSYPFIALYDAGAALLRVQGNSRTSLVVSSISNLVNIAGNAVLIFVFRMGVAGAAIATLASRVISAVAVLISLRKPSRRICVRGYLRIRPDAGRIKKILSLGIPASIENGMFQFGKIVIQSSVSMMGTTAISAQAVTAMVELMMGRAAEGIGLGMMTIVGRCIGAGLVDEAKRHIKLLTLDAEITIIAASVIVAASIRMIARLAGLEADAADLCCDMMYVICIVKPFCWSISFITGNGLRAAGDVRYLMIMSSITMWLFRVVISTVLARVFKIGPWAVWFGMFTDWFVRATYITLRYRSGKWLKKSVIDT